MGSGTDPALKTNSQTRSLDRRDSFNDYQLNKAGHSTAQKDTSVTPLAPLEYLEKHRKGSFTDPSLHAASAHPNSNSRPSSPFIGGDMNRHTDIIRVHQEVRSPSLDGLQGRPMSRSPKPVPHVSERYNADGIQYDPEINIQTGSKRKSSSDRGSVHELVGPGVDPDAPPTKRRGSVVARQRLGQGSEGQWWSHGGETLPADGGGSSPKEVIGSQHASGMAFAWPAHTHQALANPSMQNEHNDLQPTNHPQDQPHPQHAMMSSIAFSNDRRINQHDNLSQGEPSTGPIRALRTRSRPPSRQLRGTDQLSGENSEDPASPGHHSSSKEPSGTTPYSRSPELRVSHKMAERKRRKEMKDLFDELRDHLPADRGMKASKWEILSKAIDFVSTLKASHEDLARQVDMMRHELESIRGPAPSYGPGGGPPPPVVYGQGPLPPHQYPPAGMVANHPPQQPLPPHPQSRPPSQNSFPPGSGPSQQPPQLSQNGNGNGHRADGPPS